MTLKHPYRNTRKRQPRNTIPKFWRRKLTDSQVLTARIVHNDLLAKLTTGQADSQDLWDWMETGFTYAQMMKLLMTDGIEFTDEAMETLMAQLLTYEPICERLRRTGKVGLSGPEIKIAQEAAAVMDELVGMDRHGIAEQAALWSVEQMLKVQKTLV